MAIKVRFDPQAFAKLEMTRKSVHRVIFASHTDLDRNIRDQNPFDTGFSVGSWWAMVDGSPTENPESANPGRGVARRVRPCYSPGECWARHDAGKQRRIHPASR